jgi:predicted transcriptional regulator
MGRKPGLGRAESDILRYIADRYPITVREVGEYLAQTKGQTRTTALNMMERLREKGFLTRESVGGAYQYSLVQPKAGTMRGIVRDFVSQILGGSLEPFAAYLAEEAALSDTEVARLKEAIAALERREAEAGNKEKEVTSDGKTS